MPPLSTLVTLYGARVSRSSPISSSPKPFGRRRSLGDGGSILGLKTRQLTLGDLVHFLHH